MVKDLYIIKVCYLSNKKNIYRLPW